WSKSGERNFFTLNVGANIQQVQNQIRTTFPGEDIQLNVTANAVSLTGRASSAAVAEKAMAMVTSLGKTVGNNLVIAPPPTDRQILLKVRFAEVQRSTALQLGANIFSTGALNTPGAITTGQFGGPRVSDVKGAIPGRLEGATTDFTLNDILNVF